MITWKLLNYMHALITGLNMKLFLKLIQNILNRCL